MSTKDKFLKEIQSFLRREKMAESRFGKLAMNDEGFVNRLKGSRSPTAETIDRVREWMRVSGRPRRRPHGG